MALVFGAVLRLALLSYSPFAYWGSDSRSYYDFAQKLFGEGYVSLAEKRRFLYPIFLAFVTALPGVPLQWLAWIQHGLGLATVLPIAYVLRKTLVSWRWVIIPVTVLYAGHPILLWYEHELLGETLFFSLAAWAFAGWVAWAGAERVERASRLWWLFLVPFALFILTKPSGRFLWPGLALGFVLAAGWRRFGRWQAASLLAVAMATLAVGSRNQGAWLLYVATFPLTQLQSPLLPEYKAQIADLVEPLSRDLEHYHERDEEPFAFLENPGRHPDRPLWAALEKQPKRKAQVYLQLAREAVLARPWSFLYLGFTRALHSANMSEFKDQRFGTEYFAKRFRDDYESSNERLARKVPTGIPLVLGLPAASVLPPYEHFVGTELDERNRHPLAASLVKGWVSAYFAAADLVRIPAAGARLATPTFFGAWLLVAMALSFTPAYRRTWAPWCLAVITYIAGVYLVSQVNPRYFGVAWPVLIPLIALPIDFVVRVIQQHRAKPVRAASPAPLPKSPNRPERLPEPASCCAKE